MSAAPNWLRLACAGIALAAVVGCARRDTSTAAASAPHEHHAPHGGTAVVLGEEACHLELLLDPATGRLGAWILDGELENFIRIAAPGLELTVTMAGQTRPLTLRAIASSATGETVGDTSYFEAQADWLRGVTRFDGELARIEVRGSAYTAVKFNFPRGNERD